MRVEEIADGLWRWTTQHPEWTPAELEDDGWEADVGSLYYEAPDAVVLVDPLVPTEDAERERFLQALDRDLERAGRPLAIVISLFFHERSAGELAARYESAGVWAHEPALPRIATAVTNPFRIGEALPGGLQPFDAHRRDEVLLWIPEHRALVAADVLLGDGRGGLRVCPDAWLPENVSPATFRERLRPLLELPLERVLPAHGDPVLDNARDALASALHSPPRAE
ncbi:MAG: MBL fold metallo-hydrolase [Thermoleophilia bacterium]|nr:MBL fold metallo-hydrolase [Thermoleophilia bacterium]